MTLFKLSAITASLLLSAACAFGSESSDEPSQQDEGLAASSGGDHGTEMSSDGNPADSAQPDGPTGEQEATHSCLPENGFNNITYLPWFEIKHLEGAVQTSLTYYRDFDNDGLGDPNGETSPCPNDGFVRNMADDDDNEAAPKADEAAAPTSEETATGGDIGELSPGPVEDDDQASEPAGQADGDEETAAASLEDELSQDGLESSLTAPQGGYPISLPVSSGGNYLEAADLDSRQEVTITLTGSY